METARDFKKHSTIFCGIFALSVYLSVCLSLSLSLAHSSVDPPKKQHDFDAEAEEEDETAQAQAQAQAPEEDGDYVDDDGVDGGLLYEEHGDTEDRDVDDDAPDWANEAGD